MARDSDPNQAADGEGLSNGRFMGWMRIAAFPSFRKLYGRIDKDIPADTVLSFRIQSNFPVQTFDGSKYIVISTTSLIGGQNAFLGITYMAIGVICLVLSLTFFVKHKIAPRKLGDTRYLVWKNTMQNSRF